MERISIVQLGAAWGVKHRDSFLGHARTIEEAAAVGEKLVSWLESEGRPAALALPTTARASAPEPPRSWHRRAAERRSA